MDREWMNNGWVNGWMGKWINIWIKGWIDEWIDEWINKWMDTTLPAPRTVYMALFPILMSSRIHLN